MAERLVATKIGPDELADTDSAPGIKREEAFAKPGLWAGRSTTEPGVTSGWHHHGEADTVVYVLSGTVVIEFGEDRVEAGQGEFLLIPGGLVHRESTPSEGPSKSVVIRSGGEGPPTYEVDGPDAEIPS
jgi:uncharacterized RmlC-like cupin family protein